MPEENQIELTEVEMADTFTEWMRRWQEDPEQFYSEQEALQKDPKDYGESVTPYFLEILEEIRK